LSDLARRQLVDLADRSEGAIELVKCTVDGRWTVFDVALDTRGIATSDLSRIHVRARHRFEIIVDDRFPYQPPAVRVTHRRWAGTAHVQWGRQLCLYAAPSVEWDPGDGMRGLIDRLLSWLQRAAEGTLDPDGQPLHPPVTYTTASAGWIVINPDLGDRVPWSDEVQPGAESERLYAWCQRNGNRVDVLEWLTLDDAYDRVLAPEFVSTDANGRPFFMAAALLVNGELSMEYPDRAGQLVAALGGFGVTEDEMLKALTSSSTFNGAIGARAGAGEPAPTLLLLGTPSRRLDGTTRLGHLTAWRLGDLGDRITRLLARVEDRENQLSDEVRELALGWLEHADINWMDVYENRPEVTVRRDHLSAASWLTGKEVLVLGCGALGAPMAEHCIRAGAQSLTVADIGTVDPGILVRQPYIDADIGFNKARILAKRLRGIYPNVPVTAERGDVVTALVEKTLRPEEFDLVIDATADVAVRTALEAARAPSRSVWPPLITTIIGHDAQRGLVAISRSGSVGAGRDILRRLAVHAHAQGGEWRDIADDIFPHPPRTEMFFPEPGCSAPTFTGSAIQTAGLAAMLLWSAIVELANDEAVDPMAATAVRLPGAECTSSSSHITWPNDEVIADRSGRFEVRLSQRALSQMRTEARRGVRVRAEDVETGGMLLGAVDEAVQCVYVDIATGPSRDSVLTSQSFDFGTEGSNALIQHHRQRTHDRSNFVGMWHTHPFGAASPSTRDEVGMAGLVADGATKWNLMLILGGTEARWQRWLRDGVLPDLYARVIENTDAADNQPGGPPNSTATPEPSFAGGYEYPGTAHDIAKHRWWRRLLRPWAGRGT
jgi:integrative and conjugative element protein (TIGR02256 family)